MKKESSKTLSVVMCVDVGGTRTKLAKFSSQNDYIEKTINTKDLFSDVDLVVKRFPATIRNLFDMEMKTLSKLVFAVPGPVNEAEGKIVHSTVLNGMAWKRYNGFNFKECFGGLIGENNVHILNDAQAAGIGCIPAFPELKYPAMVLTLGTGCGTCLIKSNNLSSVQSAEWGLDKIDTRSQGRIDIHSCIGEAAIEHSRGQKWALDINEFYTDRTSRVSELLIKKYEKIFLEKLKSIVFLGGKTEYINKRILQQKLSVIDVIIQDDEKQKHVPLLGCYEHALSIHEHRMKCWNGRKYCIGSCGEIVKDIQSRLKKYNYFDNGKVDGIFGKHTEDSIRRFQGDYNINRNGIATPETLEKLYSDKVTNYDPGSEDNGSYGGPVN